MLTFTLPAPLRPVARSHQAFLYDLRFRTSASATQHLPADPRFIGGQLGLVGVLHTWGRTLTYHPHVHYLIPAGGVADNGQTWRPARDDFLVPVKALSGILPMSPAIGRGGPVRRARCRDALRSTELFDLVPASVWEHDWVVHCKAVGNGETAFKYLAPYVFRGAISNSRILRVENEQVTFRYRASDSGQAKLCTLAVEEFIPRFLQPVLPKGFVKVRYYGFLSVAQRAHLTTLRQQLAPSGITPDDVSTPETTNPPTRCAEACATPVTPVATHIPRAAPLASPPPADLAVSSTVSSSAETSEPQATMINPSSSSSTPLPEVRCPACGRLLLRGSVLFPTPGHPP